MPHQWEDSSADSDAEEWVKLYLNFSKSSRRQWSFSQSACGPASRF
jgi:hypothetical protein